MPQTSNSLLSPTKFMVARCNHLCAPLTALHVPYVHLTHALHAVYEWLRVPTTANHSLMCALCASYAHLCMPYAHLTHALRIPMCTLCASYVHLTRALCAPNVQFMNG